MGTKGAADGAFALPVELVLGHCRTRPTAGAVCDQDGRTTYGELERASGAVAEVVHGITAGEEGVAAIVMAPGRMYVSAMLGVARSGAAYLPVDLHEPSRRREQILRAACPAVVLTSRTATASVAPLVAAPVIELEEEATGTNWDADVRPFPDSLSYVIFTSGSSGQPRGVAVPLRALANLVRWHIGAYGLAADSRVGQVAGMGFDAALWEIWPALAAGAELVIAPQTIRADPRELRHWIIDQHLTHCFVPTALAELMLDAQWSSDVKLSALLTGGDALRRRPPDTLPFRFVNHYGPTEACVVASAGEVQCDVDQQVPSIGTAIDGVAISILDPRLHLVAAGSVGEICISGRALARGYYREPALTAARFVPDPHARNSGDRLYRTGDLGRWASDGTLQFVGRTDRQVKVRGHRVEPSEIEAAILTHPTIVDAAVTAEGGGAGELTLVAHIVASPHSSITALNDIDRLAVWQQRFDQLYSSTQSDENDVLDSVGWVSSRTAEPLARDEMRAWRDDAICWIRRLRAQRILEVGCGTGMLLSQLANECAEYDAIDISESALARLRPRLGQWPNVRLARAAAHEMNAVVRPDLVLLNSVVQYFPSLDYLDAVIARAIDLTAPGGWIFVGDVRNLQLQRAFCVWAEHADELIAADREAAAASVTRHAQHESELLVSPLYFTEWRSKHSKVADVRTLLKRSQHANEMAKFRYDVLIRLAPVLQEPVQVEWQPWSDTVTSFEIANRLNHGGVRAFGLTNVPNSRVWTENAVLRLIDGPDKRAAERAVDPSMFYSLEGIAPYRCYVSWDRALGQGAYDVVFVHKDAEAYVGMPGGRICGDEPKTNIPCVQPTRGADWSDQLRRFLAELLPAHMVPTRFRLLSSLPLTSSGKVDRRMLTGATTGAVDAADHGKKRDAAISVTLAEIWCDLLERETVSSDDDFFELGGHSLLALQLLAQIRERFAVELRLIDVFDESTLRRMTRQIERERTRSGR